MESGSSEQNRRTSNRPLAVITDLDNTILHASSYWGYLIRQGIDFFDDSIWDQWIPENLVTLVPGAFEFLKHCEMNEVEVFYVTNRNQGPKTFEYALTQLQRLNLPYANANHLTVYQETSDKTPSRRAVDQTHELILLLGDNLNDFKRDYYVSDVNKRYELMERDKSELGKKFIILPNATDGHWVRAIFGESEPAATEENRRLLLSAATRKAWDGMPTQNLMNCVRDSNLCLTRFLQSSQRFDNALSRLKPLDSDQRDLSFLVVLRIKNARSKLRLRKGY